MTDQIVQLSFPARADYLILARLALAGIARNIRIEDDQLADLKLAVTEACGNAVRHAYPDSDGSVEVAYLVSEDRLEMIVEDQGTGIETDSPREDDARNEKPLEGTMGMSIIRAIMDEVDVARGADERGTVVRMTAYLHPAEA